MSDLPNLIDAIHFAAKKHTKQRRKGADEEPYINHPLEVVNLLVNTGGVTETEILIAAVLHDTVEDTDVTKEEIAERFGQNISEIVMELTDDKSLPKAVRKEKQVEDAPHISDAAKQIKICDKISNIRDVLENPPDGWSDERRLEYVNWGERVVNGLRGVNPDLENHFDELVARAKNKIS